MIERRLSDYADATSWKTGPEALQLRVIHAAKIFEVIACVAQFDSMRGQILTEMLHTRAYYSLLIFEAISNQSIQDKVFKKIAKAALTDEQSETLLKIEARARVLRELRNKFAHSIWGASEQLPEDILCIPSNSSMDGALLLDKREHFVHGLVDPSRIQLINCVELDSVITACRSALAAYHGFFFISYSQRTYGSKDDGFWSELGFDPAGRAKALIKEFFDLPLT